MILQCLEDMRADNLPVDISNALQDSRKQEGAGLYVKKSKTIFLLQRIRLKEFYLKEKI